MLLPFCEARCNHTCDNTDTASAKLPGPVLNKLFASYASGYFYTHAVIQSDLETRNTQKSYNSDIFDTLDVK